METYNLKIKDYREQTVISLYNQPIVAREKIENIIIQLKRYRSLNSELLFEKSEGKGVYFTDPTFLDAEIKMMLFDEDLEFLYDYVKIKVHFVYEAPIHSDFEKEERSLRTSLGRTKQKVFDLAFSNEWDMFVTLTFSDVELEKRYGDKAWNYDVCVKALHSFFTVLKRKYSDVQYLGVPELHHNFYNVSSGDVVFYNGNWFKDTDYEYLLNKKNRSLYEEELIKNVLNGTYKRRFHFHFLFNNFPISELTDSGERTSKGQVIYNLMNYKLGFTTCTMIESLGATQHYITKYISKDLISVSQGRKRYWASKNLQKPTEENFIIDTEEQQELKQELSLMIKSDTRKKKIRIENDNFSNTIYKFVALKNEYTREWLNFCYKKVVLEGYDNFSDERALTFLFTEMISPFSEDTYFECDGKDFFFDFHNGVVKEVFSSNTTTLS